MKTPKTKFSVKLSFATERRIAEKYEAEFNNWCSIESLSKDFGVSISLIRSILIHWKVQLRQPGLSRGTGTRYIREQSSVSKKMCALWDKGLSSKTISKQLGLSRLEVAYEIRGRRKKSERVILMVRAVIRSLRGTSYGPNRAKILKLMNYEREADICEICEKESKLVVDHCHSKDKVRGFLCNNCNTAIGMFKESTLIMRAAIKYISQKRDQEPGRASDPMVPHY